MAEGPWNNFAPSQPDVAAAEGPWTKYQPSKVADPRNVAKTEPKAGASDSGDGLLAKAAKGFGREAMSTGAAAGETFGDMALGGQELAGRALRAAGFNGAGDWLINDAQSGAEKLKAEAAPYRKAAPVASFVGDLIGGIPVAELGIGGPFAKAITSGAVAGGLQPTAKSSDFATEKAKQIGLGAAGGAAAGGAGKVFSSAIAPQLSDDASALVSRGVRLTPGQMIGGPVKRAEDSLASLPVVGSFVGGAQRKSVETFNRSVINDALEPIGESLPKNIDMGHDAIAAAHDRVSDAYNRLLPNLTFRTDQTFKSDLQSLRSLAGNMPPDQAKQFEDIIHNNLLSRLAPTGTMLGPSLKIVESDLGKFASQYRSSSVASEQQLGDAVRETQQLLRDTLERQNPTDAQRLRDINSAFARLVRVEGAASNRSTSGGVFTPADLLTSIKKSDTSSRKSATATGRALGQDFATSAQNILPNKTPNSGTPERLMWQALLGGEYFQNPHIALGLGAATLPYTDPAIAALNRLAQPAGPTRKAASNIAQELGVTVAPGAGIEAEKQQ